MRFVNREKCILSLGPYKNSGNPSFRRKEGFPGPPKKSISKGIFVARSAKKCLPNESFFGKGPGKPIFAKNGFPGKYPPFPKNFSTKQQFWLQFSSNGGIIQGL